MEAVIVRGVVMGLAPNREVKGMARSEGSVSVSEVGVALVDELESRGRYCMLELYMRDIQSLAGLKGDERVMSGIFVGGSEERNFIEKDRVSGVGLGEWMDQKRGSGVDAWREGHESRS